MKSKVRSTVVLNSGQPINSPGISQKGGRGMLGSILKDNYTLMKNLQATVTSQTEIGQSNNFQIRSIFLYTNHELKACLNDPTFRPTFTQH